MIPAAYSRIGRSVALAAALWSVTLTAAAADPVIRTSLRPNSGITDTQVLQFAIQVENADQSPTVSRLQDLRNLGVLSGPSTGQNTRIYSGPSGTVSSITYTFTWSLRALGPGEAAIPAVDIQIGDKSYKTDPLRFQVTAGSSAPPRPGVQPPGNAPPENEVFLRAELSGNEVFVGEPVLLSLTLLARPQIGDLNWVDRPDFSRFWVEQVPTDPEREGYVTEVAGQQFYAFPLERRMLVPTSRGSVTIDPYSLQLVVTARSRDLLRSFFSRDRGKRIILKTDPLSLSVKELPASGRPASFSGAVGEFLMSAELDRTDAMVDDAVALRVTVEGEGFLKPVQPPDLDPPPGLRIQDPKSEESTTIRSGKMISRKTWEWLMVPASPGEMPIPEVKFGWFDPKAGRYRERVENGLVLNVVKGDGVSPGARTGGRLLPQGSDIQYIKLVEGDLDLGTRRLHEQGWFQLLVLAPVLLLPAGIGFGRWYARRSGDLRQMRSRKARSKAKKRLSAAGKRMEGGEDSGFHEEVARALVDYVADRFDRSSSGLTYDDVERLLVSRSVPSDLVRRFRECVEACDFARYVPASSQTGRQVETLKEARDVLAEMEKVL